MVPWGIISKKEKKYRQNQKIAKNDKNRQKKWPRSDFMWSEVFFLFKNMGVWDVICKKGKKGPQIIPKNDQNRPKIGFYLRIGGLCLLRNLGFWGKVCKQSQNSFIRPKKFQKMTKIDQKMTKIGFYVINFFFFF